jgi:hypothetical protein
MNCTLPGAAVEHSRDDMGKNEKIAMRTSAETLASGKFFSGLP